MVAPPSFNCRVLAASTVDASWISANELAVPPMACDTALASRCDCICAWPVAPTCVALRLAEVRASTVATTSPTRPSTTNAPRMRCCAATGRPPMNGNNMAAGAARAAPAAEAAGITRDSVKSLNSPEGGSSEMMDPPLMLEVSEASMVGCSDAAKRDSIAVAARASPDSAA